MKGPSKEPCNFSLLPFAAMAKQATKRTMRSRNMRALTALRRLLPLLKEMFSLISPQTIFLIKKSVLGENYVYDRPCLLPKAEVHGGFIISGSECQSMELSPSIKRRRRHERKQGGQMDMKKGWVEWSGETKCCGRGGVVLSGAKLANL